VFDSSSSGRLPSPSEIFKVRLDGSGGTPENPQYVLIRVSGKAKDGKTTITAGPCGSGRSRVAEADAGDRARGTAWVYVGGHDLCIGAMRPTTVRVDLLGSG